MPGMLSSMRSAKFLNREKVIKKLVEISGKARERNKNIRQVILFGSLADGTCTATSDADLLIVIEDGKDRFIDRIPEFLMYFVDAPVAVDVFPYKEDEIIRVPLAQRAISNGIVLVG